LARGPLEPVNEDLLHFYERLWNCLKRPEVREGEWSLLECKAAWDGNWTWDCFICFAWRGAAGGSLVVIVNYAPNQSQCNLQIPFEELRGREVRLTDQMGPAQYDRQGDDILSRGLYLDLPAWGCHVFDLSARNGESALRMAAK